MTVPAITSLLAEIPSTDLFLKELDDGRHAVQHSGGAVFLYRNTPEGVAYAKLAVEAMKALNQQPGTATRHAAMSAVAPTELAEGGTLPQQFQSKIEGVLALNPAFSSVPVKLLSKLLYAAIAPLVNPDSLEQASASPERVEPRPGDQSPAAQRLAGVESFCDFLLTHGDQFSMPSESALLAYANNWNESQNGGQAAA
ncbi:hypothetical protein ACR3H8_19920 [Pseudomonas aeruginosa]|uniref:hypothetical protein n=2 Tax=Pseudomonas aeruginosa TaxID=287 RepID=UPI0003BB06BE|nr:hypothetical protein [Pseudomonas aeruginosa]EIU2716140.1 hypothetical protein [Pseudomonas aeruginosa]ERW61388.1 hypothetical protein Q024_06435 [Pseudomonas aeruginosa BWHPSA011]ETV28861.1 hypothetical protein Q046_05778 [Pseudomonas aeruginosa BWHPSA041]ETV55867.1 hypothetical protein Q042_05276 [Pseudomonas aeruginosa BWHPSA037]MBA5210116.1 hypothetical protein [Pseudomonas aeruginosa]